MTKLNKMINLKAAVKVAILLTVLSGFIAESAQASLFSRKKNRINRDGSNTISGTVDFSLYEERLENGFFVPIPDDNQSSSDIGLFEGAIEEFQSEITGIFTEEPVNVKVGDKVTFAKGTLKAEVVNQQGDIFSSGYTDLDGDSHSR